MIHALLGWPKKGRSRAKRFRSDLFTETEASEVTEDEGFEFVTGAEAV